MKKLGIIGGIGPASTIAYYQSIIELFQKELATKDYPELILHSIDMTAMLNLVAKSDEEGLVHFLKSRIAVLEKSGADFAVLASNTPHLVFDQLAMMVNIPLISIVEETCILLSKNDLKKVGLLGTKSTMTKGFYQKKGLEYGVEIIVPNSENQDFVHKKYMEELIFNEILPATKKQLLVIVEKMVVEESIEGIVLGGTELPLILSQADFKEIEVLDTTQIHVKSILKKMMEE